VVIFLIPTFSFREGAAPLRRRGENGVRKSTTRNDEYYR